MSAASVLLLPSGVLLLLVDCQAARLDNGVVGIPEVQCMEDRVRMLFRTERPFTGRIFVKGMVSKDQCVNSFIGNTRSEVQFEMSNGQCNMRRSRKLGPEQKGVEQSITVIISFHETFITKVDRAYRCTCFYMEADRVVTSRFDVSMLPTTDVLDTAKMPLCTYTVRRGSANGGVVSFATVGEPVFHVWQCESDMFSMLVHSCFVDDGNGQERKQLLDEHGCAVEQSIVPDLTYNDATNMAFAEVNVFKFADKVSTYFQCAVSTCMQSEGMCDGKTPPRCGFARQPNLDHDFDAILAVGKHRQARNAINPIASTAKIDGNKSGIYDDEHTMDLSAGKITVLDLEERNPELDSPILQQSLLEYNTPPRLSTMLGRGRWCTNSLTLSLISGTVGSLFLTLISLLTVMLLRKRLAKSSV